jgi:hypothetical protein
MNNLKKLLLLCIGLGLFLGSLAACAGSSREDSGFPSGKFVLPNDQFTGYQFNADGTWTYFAFGEIGAEGKYSVKGNQWTEQGTEECPFVGTYEWSYDGSNLTFKLVGEDQCDPRREATDGVTFVLSK